MFAITYLTFNHNVVIGPLIMYSILFFLCIYGYVKRSSIDKNISLYNTIIVAVFGLLNSILLLVASDLNTGYTAGVLPAGLFFGLILTPLTWMTGITLFSSINREKVPTMVKAGYFLTFIQTILIVIVIAFLTKYLNQPNGNEYASSIFSNTYIATTSINWVYFMLYAALVIYYRFEYGERLCNALIVFGVLNTIRLITETVFLVQGGNLQVTTFLYIVFFFTDFVSSISLYVGIHFFKNLDFD
ncbi:hypothetical protein K501DRAFT_277016 [Backusella circina FSU 941]|nr:hypothetical protein K501DRAFT_277016 [Backusella circina FSU 941]